MQIFSVSQSHYRQMELSWGKLLLYSILGGLGMALAITAGAILLNRVYKDFNIKAQLEENEFLHHKIAKMESRFNNISMKMRHLENTTRDLKIMANLPDTATSGPSKSLIEPSQDLYLAYAGDISEYDSLRIEAVIDNLEQRLDETMRLQNAIKHRFQAVEDELKHMPSIRPLPKGRISDLFGKRIDPFIQKIRHHNGIDISAPQGTDVYAPAAGIVELVKTRYRLNRGYGRVVIINHGRGIKTLYGHLSKIFVKKGQKVERWDVIGQVGETGRATGPHLHYEVWQNGKAIDPLEYILN